MTAPPDAEGKRSVPEWIGKTPDAKVPPHVRARIFEREHGRCWLSGRKIMPGEPWELDHKRALCNGGRHAESNLAPALKDKHAAKTARDVAERAKTDHVKMKHLGIKTGRGFPKHPTLKRGVDGRVVPRLSKIRADFSSDDTPEMIE